MPGHALQLSRGAVPLVAKRSTSSYTTHIVSKKNSDVPIVMFAGMEQFMFWADPEYIAIPKS
jgi:hypothetical protein